ncbi:heme ABC exporter ATP-binding protein CcmA [Hyphococcus flavus]|uniref:Heme ABC exporter ATP-binding protein CcmA n=1 Tax=Hyphococcus flavus TaxID=1866326 RepID=A0AAE9ZAS4_9PROT|nr:heme ABC exporter ATP-binding protein CcmA [Hyphococcus flavus]WDI30863.1 heme ABC exporter ATP-binding protein CcmA [Hyphococcus flavus]
MRSFVSSQTGISCAHCRAAVACWAKPVLMLEVLCSLGTLMEPYAQQIGFEAENAGCDRAGEPVVRGVSFSFSPGDALQLFGPNGSGKSSLLSMFAGLIPLAEGALRWHLGDEQSATPFEQSVFFLGHDASVKPSLTARENLSFWAACYGAGKERIDAAIDSVKAMTFADLRASRLSAGQRRRIDLARAVLADRPVWLLDEPAAAIDSDGVEVIRNMIAEHRARGGLAIIATHDHLGSGYQRLELGR